MYLDEVLVASDFTSNVSGGDTPVEEFPVADVTFYDTTKSIKKSRDDVRFLTNRVNERICVFVLSPICTCHCLRRSSILLTRT